MHEHGPINEGVQQGGEGAELQRSLTQMAACLDELTHQLHVAAPGDANVGAQEETRPLMKALHGQLSGDGADAWARALGETASDEETDYSSADFGQRLRAQTEEPCENVADFKRVMQRAITAAQAGWQARLDADLATATDVWSERVKNSIDSSVERAADLVTQSSQQTARELEQAIAERKAIESKSFKDAGSKAEGQMASVRYAFDGEMKREQEILARVSATATTIDDQAARLASMTEISQEELRRRGSSMLEWHSEQLVQHAKQSIAECDARLQSALETAGRGIVTKLGAEFEQQLNARLDRTRGILDRLESEGRAVESLLRTHQERIEKFSDQAVESVLGRLEKAGTNWEARIGEAGRAAASKWTPQASPVAVPGANAGSAGSCRPLRETEHLREQPADVWLREGNGKAGTNNVSATLKLEKERRTVKRLKIARPLLSRPEDPAYKEVVETTRNASRYGVYFTTPVSHYYVGMHLRVTLGYTPNDPCNASSFGKIVRIDPLEDGGWGIAVRILLR